MYQHTLRWQGTAARLIYSISDEGGVRQLVLDDVQAASLEVANSVPDWKVESEAGAVAIDHGARYL